MSIRIIRKAGEVIAYQALVGAGGPSQTAYFPVSSHGTDQALALAAAAAAALLAQHPKRPRLALQGNTGGIPGLQLVYMRSRRDDPPILYAQAQWTTAGTGHNRKYSTQKHGNVGAVALALAARERGIGRKTGLQAGDAYEVMRRTLDQKPAP